MQGHRIRRPVGDEHYLVIELDFSSREQAEAFRQFLYNVVSANSDASPALAGPSQARVPEPIAEASGLAEWDGARAGQQQ